MGFFFGHEEFVAVAGAGRSNKSRIHMDCHDFQGRPMVLGTSGPCLATFGFERDRDAVLTDIVAEKF